MHVPTLMLRTFTAPVELRTPRLLLRQWKDDDLEAWATMNADPAVRRYFPSVLTRTEALGEAGRIRASIAHEYEQFAATLARWSKLTDAWYQKTREQLVQRWDEADFRAETRALLAELRLQHQRLKLLDAQLA